MGYFMYVCPECRKVFKVQGNDKKVKCSNCANILKDMRVAIEDWETMDKLQREDVKNATCMPDEQAEVVEYTNDDPISEEIINKTTEEKPSTNVSRSSFFDDIDDGSANTSADGSNYERRSLLDQNDIGSGSFVSSVPELGPKNTVTSYNTQNSDERAGHSTLSIIAMILCILGCASIIGLILAIIDLVKGKYDDNKHTCSWIGVGFASLWFIIGVALGLSGKGSDLVSPTQPKVEVKDNRADADSKDVSAKTNDNSDAEQSATSATAGDEEFEKTGYLYENSIGDTLYFYIVKNNSKAAVMVDGNAIAYDSSGNSIGADQAEIEILGPGETSLMYFYFDSVKGIDKVECSLSYDTTPYYMPVVNSIRMEQTMNDKNLTVVATNEGNLSAQFVEAYALFFDSSNKLISYDSAYITDGDSELKPGATMSAQLDAYNGFDHVECYLIGRSNGQSTSSTSEVSDSDFAVKEYSYVNSIGDTKYYLVIKNNCSKTVGIDANMTAYDSGENVIGAANSSIDVLGPGEETIASFYFDSVTGIDHVDYTLGYNTSPYYESGLADLEIVHNINPKNVVVSVTNNGSEPSKFLEAYALFFDSSGILISADSTYITDNDSELKPGATLSKQIDSYNPFDSVEVYLVGRRGGF